MAKKLIFAVVLLLPLQSAFAQYDGWRHSGSLAVLTTPDGANLPDTAREEGFPVLVRLNKESFDFHQAKSDGADIRFSQDGKPLSYQIEQWDAEDGTAAIWVRLPVIHGNSRQEIELHWGNSDAAGESNGAAVFNSSNGFLEVMHLSDRKNPMKDEVSSLAPIDAGTTASPGVIAGARHFQVGKGISCGEKVAGFPVGASPHSTEVWFRADRSNATIVGWGNEQARGKVVMQLASPPHMRMDCYFSGGNVSSVGRLPTSQWIHVVHTYTNTDSRLYVNGRLDGIAANANPVLNIRSPVRMWIGGWYNNYNFSGDIAEVRISKVARSADWVKLEYENQKLLQTLVGTLAQPGDFLTVSPSAVTIGEGKHATLTARAGGAKKVYWILKRNGETNVVAVDRFSYTFDAGRVVGDTACSLQFKAIFASGAKTVDIPAIIKETIPEPEFTLRAPPAWNGRDRIKVVPEIANLAAMQTAGAGQLNYKWTVSGGAVLKAAAPDRLILKRSQFTGPITVTAAIDNGGPATIASATIEVTEPAKDPWIERVPLEDEKPEDNQFYARDDHNEGTLYYNGVLDRPAEGVFLKLYAGDRLVTNEFKPLKADKSYSFALKIKPGLIEYRVEFGARIDGTDTVRRTAKNLLCGDAFLIDGQSNALATDTGEESPREISPWIRSYGSPAGGAQDVSQNLWCNPVWKARPSDKAELGYWGMELARRLVKSEKIPIFIINGAVGGTRIDQHQPSPANHADLDTIYGRMLWRIQQAKLTHGIRAILWHQGENDQGADGPTGKFGWQTYQQYFVDMSAAWKEDFPNLSHYYIFQIWPNACAMGGREGSGDRLREVQRTLPHLYSNMSIMSTLGIKPAGGCHYPLAGWAEFAALMQPLIERDFYGSKAAASITPPDLHEARYTNADKDEIVLEFDQKVIWHDALKSQFYLDGKAGLIISGQAVGSNLKLKLKAASSARKITYLKEADWNPENILHGAGGIAAMTFDDVQIEPPSP